MDLKKINSPEEKAGAPAYMVSFGDMITNILTFFILMLAFAKDQDPGAAGVGAKSFRDALQDNGLTGIREALRDLLRLKHSAKDSPPEKTLSLKMEAKGVPERDFRPPLEGKVQAESEGASIRIPLDASAFAEDGSLRQGRLRSVASMITGLRVRIRIEAYVPQGDIREIRRMVRRLAGLRRQICLETGMRPEDVDGATFMEEKAAAVTGGVQMSIIVERRDDHGRR